MSSSQLLIKHISYPFCNQFLSIFITNSCSLLKILLGWFALISLWEASVMECVVFLKIKGAWRYFQMSKLQSLLLLSGCFFQRFLDGPVVPSTLSDWSIRCHALSLQSTEYTPTCPSTRPSTGWHYRCLRSFSSWPALFYTAHKVQCPEPSGY